MTEILSLIVYVWEKKAEARRREGKESEKKNRKREWKSQRETKRAGYLNRRRDVEKNTDEKKTSKEYTHTHTHLIMYQLSSLVFPRLLTHRPLCSL